MKLNKIRNFFLKNWNAKLICLAIAVIISLFYKQGTVEERYLRVPFGILTPGGFVTVDDIPKNVRISLKGNRNDIYSIISDDIIAYADFRDVTEEGSYERSIRIERTGNALYMSPLEISVEPLTVSAFFEKKSMRRVGITPVFQGMPAEGYEIAGSFLLPGTVSVEGPENIIKRIDMLKIKPVSIDGKSENFTVPVEIESPGDHVELNAGTVMLSVKIARIRIAKTFSSVAIELRGCAEGLSAVSSAASGSIKVETGSNESEWLSAGSMKLVADLSTVAGPGTYTVPLRPAVAENVDVISFSPETVEITVSPVIPASEE